MSRTEQSPEKAIPKGGAADPSPVVHMTEREKTQGGGEGRGRCRVVAQSKGKNVETNKTDANSETNVRRMVPKMSAQESVHVDSDGTNESPRK